MDLARRRRGSGEAEPLAPGTVSRVQLSPYREVLAGVQTTVVTALPLSREISTFGSVEFNETKEEHIAARQKGKILKLHVNYTGQMVHKGDPLAEMDIRYGPELMATLEDLRRARQNANRDQAAMAVKRLQLWNLTDAQIEELVQAGEVRTRLTIYSPIHGHVIRKYQREGNYVEEGTPLYDVADLDTVWVQAQVYEADQGLLRVGQRVRATTGSLPNEVFEGTLDFIYPHLDESSRTLAVRFFIDHNPEHKLRPGMYATVRIAVAPGQIDLFARALDHDWALATALDGLNPLSGLPALLRAARDRALLQRGWVLAVPESAVIDTGNLKIVYRQAAANLYEGVAVELGPRLALAGQSAAFYPMLHGLQEGDRIVTNGAFLIDAETRLNPVAGSVYSGTSGKQNAAANLVRPSTPANPEAQRPPKAQTGSSNSQEDRP
jgi:Cu(I)/Ag(I) efflux system membrane fusion protein